ncbi:MAG: hypothetical protein ACXVMS_13950 [Flavisolibacter sp.]
MFKQSILIGLLFVVTSGGQNSQPTVVNATNESSIKSPKINIADTIVKPSNMSLTIKHLAYNQDIKDIPPSLAQFVPEGYTAIDTTSGDLNLDAHSDMIIVLKKNGEDTTSNVVEHPEKRPLLILIGQANNIYRLAARNDNAVNCIDCGGMMGDPFMQVVIKKGYFSIEHYGGSGWRWSRTITFKYSPADNYWYLHKDVSGSFHVAEPEKVTTKVKTKKYFGKVPFNKFDIYK